MTPQPLDVANTSGDLSSSDPTSADPTPGDVTRTIDDRPMLLATTAPYHDEQLPVGDYLRRLRREADLSQRELADRVPVSLSSIARMEAGRLEPRVHLLESVFDLVGWRLAVLNGAGREVRPLREYQEDLRDGAERRYPAHLDVYVEPHHGEWWADTFGLARPPETFRRDRAERDWARARSQFELGRGRWARGR